MDNRIDISVIIPVYNGELYLEEALESLRNQTLGTIEIICIDDGSEDRTVEILETFEHKDRRIKVYHQDHQGAATARNQGLFMALGEYVIFLDADDIFDVQMLEKVVEKGKKTEADVVVFGAKRYDTRTGEIIDVPWYLKRELIPEKEVFGRKDVDGRILELTIPSPWTKAFKRQFILEQKILFQDIPNSNDIYFSLVALAVADRVCVVREDLLYYRIFREGSLQNGKDKNPLCFLDAYEATYDELKKRGIYEEVARSFCHRVLSGCVYNLNTVYTEEAYWKIMNALCTERFVRMGLLDFPEDYYAVPRYRDQIKGIPYAIDVRKMIEKKEIAGAEPEVWKKGSGIDCKKKVSVIIPVYNTEAYLSECMEGILNQTLEELEIICIDDGSTDGSAEILDFYAEKDERITVFRQENTGQAAARNIGIEKSCGEYIYFMDSDDILCSDALEHLYQRGKEHDLEVIYFDGDTLYENNEIKERYPEFQDYYTRKGEYPIMCSGIEMFLKMSDTKEYRVNPGIQFFKREFLVKGGFLFEPGIIHEDNDFTFRTMLSAKRAGYVDAAYFRRRVREASTMTTNDQFAHIYGYFKGFLNMLSFLEEKAFPEEMTDVLYRTIHGMIGQVRSQYNKLTNAEKYAFIGLKGTERIKFQLFVENDSVNYVKLQRTYAEKSEINRKLQITYGEKYERGLKIKGLEKELASIKKSRSYRLARMIGFPVRIFRKMIDKIRS